MSTHSSHSVKPNPTQLDFHARIPDTILTHPNLSDYAVRLYGVMQSRAGTRRWFWNTIAELAEMSGKSKKSRESVYRATKQLEAIGAIHVEHTYMADNRNGTAKYHVLDWSGIDADPDRTRLLMSNASVPCLSAETPVSSPKNTPVSQDRPRPDAVPYADPFAQKTLSSTPCSTTDAVRDENRLNTPTLQGQKQRRPKDKNQLPPKRQLNELANHPGDSVTDRVVRHVAEAIEVKTRIEARAWLTNQYGDWEYFDDGSKDRSWWVGALRQMIVGYDGHPAMGDEAIREIVQAAKKMDHLDALVDFVGDGTWPSEREEWGVDYSPAETRTEPSMGYVEAARKSWDSPVLDYDPWTGTSAEAPPW